MMLEKNLTLEVNTCITTTIIRMTGYGFNGMITQLTSHMLEVPPEWSIVASMVMMVNSKPGWQQFMT